jgi:HSP20 family protein
MKTLQRKNGEHGISDPWRDFFDIENFLPASFSRHSLPAVNISEDDKCYCVDVVAPGFRKNDFHVNVDDDMLTISAETKSETPESNDKNREFSRREYSYSSFTRSFRLPDNVRDESISANYTDGILHLNIPKSEPESRPKKEVRVD